MHIRTSVLTSTLSACSVLAAPHLRLKRAPAGPQGIDVSGFQPNIDWNAVKANGVEFAYIKATEGTSKHELSELSFGPLDRMSLAFPAYTSPEFSKQYTGATNVGLIRGGYHFAQPSAGSGADQANFFLANGGGWSSDGRTLPGALDLEGRYNISMCDGRDLPIGI
jgi:GH25 family lysozyme M1 (1,4-beta-N-acetylmuramidase)